MAMSGLRRAAVIFVAALGSAGVSVAGPPCEPELLGTLGGQPFGVALGDGVAVAANRQGRATVYGTGDPSDVRVLGAAGDAFASFYVAIEGGFAYSAATDRLEVTDLSDPMNPLVVGSIELSDATALYGVDVVGGVAYLADFGGWLRMVDVSDPAAPQELGAVALAGRPLRVTVEGGVAYVANDTEPLEIVDVGDPLNPVVVGSIDEYTKSISAVAVEDERAYVVDWRVGFTVHDVSDPSSPAAVSALVSADIADIVVDGSLAYAAGPGGLYVFDVSDPADPVRLARIDDSFTMRRLAHHDGLLCVSTQFSGLRFYDASDPGSPGLVDALPSVDVSEQAPVVSGGLAVLPLQTSVATLDVSDPARPQPLAEVFGLYRSIVGRGGNAYFIGDNGSGGDGYGVLDLDPSALARVTGFRQFDGDDFHLGQVVAGRYASVLRAPSEPGGGNLDLLIVDLDDPTTPSFEGSVALPLTANGRYAAIVGGGDRAYVAQEYVESGEFVSRLVTLDLSDPMAPSVLHVEESLEFRRLIDVVGPRVYAADGEDLRIIEVSPEGVPEILSTVEFPGFLIDVEVAGDVVHGLGAFGVRAFDLALPEAPAVVWSADLEDLSLHSPVALSVADRVVYVVDAVRGLLTIDVRGCGRPADLDGDGVVGSGDLGALLAAWGSGDAAADLDGDGVVGEADLGILLSAWGG